MSATTPDPIGVVHVGLGPIGLETARLVQSRPSLRSVAAVDIAPGLVGRDLGSLLGGAALGVPILGDIVAADGASVAILCTGSRLPSVFDQLISCIDAGLHVVSSCEELSFPWERHPDLARRLDDAARQAGVTVLGTGVNPGFAMDTLPVTLSAVMRTVDHVRVHRVQDAGTRRIPLQKKVGAGLPLPDMQALIQAGTAGHVGLKESAWAIAAALGWRLTSLTESIEALTAERETPGGLGMIPPGATTGIRQIATGMLGDSEVISLQLDMAVGLPDPRDEVVLSGDPGVRLTVPGGLHGDSSTQAILVNAVTSTVRASPGLRTMTDVPPAHPF